MMRTAHMAVMAVALSGCMFMPEIVTPGEDMLGKHLKVEADPVAAALAAFERKNGHLPARLDELVPAYVAAIPADMRLSYEPSHRRFGFTYERPLPDKGMANCFKTIGLPDWTCDGYL